MNAKQHYDNHLSHFYAWMCGPFEQRVSETVALFRTLNLLPDENAVAIDLGAGHGIQTIALCRMGHSVYAVDFNITLLNELKNNAAGYPVSFHEADIREVKHMASIKPALIGCWGDTITHLDSKEDIQQLISDCALLLNQGGKLALSFRDYTTALEGNQRLIPVKSDPDRILTCLLEYETERIRVTDILYEPGINGWQQKISSYYKVRITSAEVRKMLHNSGFIVTHDLVHNRMVEIVAEKI